MKSKATLAILMLSSATLPSAVLAEATTSTAAIALPAQLGPNARERYRDIFANIDAGK